MRDNVGAHCGRSVPRNYGILHPTTLRIHRRRNGFTQRELAMLIGMQVHSLVSRHESLKREPDLRAAFAYQLVFGTTAHELFPALFTDVCNKLAARAEKLASVLRSTGDGNRVKLRTLQELAGGKSELPFIG